MAQLLWWASILCVWMSAADLMAQPLTPRQSEAIDAVFAEQGVTPSSPGCGLALIRSGSIEHFKGYGLASVGTSEKWTPATVFHTGSIYKQFHAAAIIILASDGKLSLDDDVRKYIPELPDYGDHIAVRDLLTHTHGLREHVDLVELTSAESIKNDADVLRLIARQRQPAAAPRTRLRYGNTGPFLAGVIVERVSGMPVGEFIARKILVPFGMSSTTFAGDSRSVPPATPGYIRQDDGSFKERTGGTARTTLADLARWDANFQHADDGWRSLLKTLTSPGELRDGTALDMGMAVRVRPFRGLRRVWVAHADFVRCSCAFPTWG